MATLSALFGAAYQGAQTAVGQALAPPPAPAPAAPAPPPPAAPGQTQSGTSDDDDGSSFDWKLTGIISGCVIGGLFVLMMIWKLVFGRKKKGG